MNSYDHLVPEGTLPDLPSIGSLHFHEAGDVVAVAQVDRSMGWMTWPEVWHLDHEGRVQCYSKGSSLESIRSWADDSSPLRRARLEGLRDDGCADRWVIVESRPSWRHEQPTVDESDAEAFGRLRRSMSSFGVSLLDVVIFDDQRHWWSLHQLTSGTDRWC